jgi:hypothetical protein
MPAGKLSPERRLALAELLGGFPDAVREAVVAAEEAGFPSEVRFWETPPSLTVKGQLPPALDALFRLTGFGLTPAHVYKAAPGSVIVKG